MRRVEIIGLFFFIITMPIFAKMNSPEEFAKINSKYTKTPLTDPFIIPLYFSVRFYQVIISPIKQENCRMYPSCSHYGINSLKENGILGVFMTVDRLNRCGHDLQYYKRIIVGNKVKYLDLVKKKK